MFDDTNCSRENKTDKHPSKAGEEAAASPILTSTREWYFISSAPVGDTERARVHRDEESRDNGL